MKFLKLPSLRSVHTFGVFTCVFLLAFALYLQSFNGLVPCPLCVIQRIVIFILGLLFLVGALHVPNKRWRLVHNTVIFLVAALGILAAGRQAFLESLPPGQAPPCGPTFEYILQTFPFRDAIAQIIAGTPDCATVTWVFLGLSIPSWTLLFFILFAVIGIFQALRD